MARAKSSPPSVAPKLTLDPAAIKRGIARLEERIAELQAFDIATLVDGNSPELMALTAAIKDTLERCFGENTSAYNRLKAAYQLRYIPMVFMGGGPAPDYIGPTRKNIISAVALLKEAQRTLREDLVDFEHETGHESSDALITEGTELSRRIFVVHGHDEGARETVARFLERLGFEAIILHEKANRGRTVIEKVEDHGDVGFAVVLLTPDDEGCTKGGTSEPRARQNVLLELGYFLGRLGRDKVCALKRGTVEIPSDFAGVVWESMEDGNGWKLALGRELQAAGHDIDWNKVMRL